jgi:hypothetical protein
MSNPPGRYSLQPVRTPQEWSAYHAIRRSVIVINAHPTSLTFYLANGYREGEWRDAGPVPATLIRVGKRLT